MLVEKMNPLSRDLGNALLQRHKKLCMAMPDCVEDVSEENVASSIIPYKGLLASIGAPETLAISIGKYLYEVACWCEDKGYPPVNALAVNGELHRPGSGFYLAPQGNDWDVEVRKCIACKQYPPSILESDGNYARRR